MEDNCTPSELNEGEILELIEDCDDILDAYENMTHMLGWRSDPAAAKLYSRLASSMIWRRHVRAAAPVEDAVHEIKSIRDELLGFVHDERRYEA